VWDVQKAEAKLSVSGSNEYAVSLEWNHNGSLLGTTWKDKNLRIIDPRSNSYVVEQLAHEGAKPQKFSWLGNSDYYMTVGFSKQYEREY